MGAVLSIVGSRPKTPTSASLTPRALPRAPITSTSSAEPAAFGILEVDHVSTDETAVFDLAQTKVMLRDITVGQGRTAVSNEGRGLTCVLGYQNNGDKGPATVAAFGIDAYDVL